MSKIHPVDHPKCLSAKTTRTHSQVWTRDSVSLPPGKFLQDSHDFSRSESSALLQCTAAWSSISSSSKFDVRRESERCASETQTPSADTTSGSLAVNQAPTGSLSPAPSPPSTRDSMQSEQSKAVERISAIRVSVSGQSVKEKLRDSGITSRSSSTKPLRNVQSDHTELSAVEAARPQEELELHYEPIVQRNCRSAALPQSAIVADKEDTLSLPGQLDAFSTQDAYVSTEGCTSSIADKPETLIRNEPEIGPVLLTQDSYLQSESEASLLVPKPTKEEEPVLTPRQTVNESTQLPPISVLRRVRNQKRGCCSSSMAFLGYSLCALLVYPLLLVILPFLILGKLLCCVPCIRRHLGKELHTVPMFFAEQRVGGYYTVVAFLKERLARPERFEEICVNALNDAYTNNRKGIVLKLASKLKKTLGFLRWKHEGKAPLAEHVIAVLKQVTTDRDVSHLIQDLVQQQRSKKLWAIYFVPNYKNTQSAVVLLVHHSIAAGSNLKNTLLSLLPVNKPLESDLEDVSLYEKPSMLTALWKAPGVFFRNMKIRPRTNMCGETKYNFTSVIPLKKAFQIANKAGCSLDALFLSCLAQAYRNCYPQRQRSLGDPVFAVPDTFQASSSAFFVHLPISQRRPLSFEQLLQQMDYQINHNCEQAYILGIAGRVTSVLFSRRVTDILAKSVANRAVGVFCLVDCTSEPVFIDDHYIVSSILTWPPLYQKLTLSVVVVCYQNSFRVCVGTDRSDLNRDRPSVLVDNLVSVFENMHYHFCCK